MYINPAKAMSKPAKYNVLEAKEIKNGNDLYSKYPPPMVSPASPSIPVFPSGFSQNDLGLVSCNSIIKF